MKNKSDGVLNLFYILSLAAGVVMLLTSTTTLLSLAGAMVVAGSAMFLGSKATMKNRGSDSNITHIVDKLSYIRKGDYNLFLEGANDEYSTEIVQTVNHLTAKVSTLTRNLASEKRKTEYILDNMDSGLLLVDSAFNVRQCNSSAYKYLTSADDLLGRNLAEIPEASEFISAVENALKREISSMFDLDLTTSTGVIVSVRINPIAGEWVGDEKNISAVIMLTNVTQSRQMERLRSEFVANVSHELKTPITSINGFAELIQSGVVSDGEKVSEYVGRIYEEAQRMTNLIDDILRLSSLESKQAEEVYEAVDLKILCEDIFISLSPIMTKRGIAYDITGSASFFAYPDDMHQLMKNLLENAVKYNRDGGTVSVRLSPDAYSCTIGVSDTGIGIPLEHQARIFERFYRVDKGRSKRVGGTGLGLSIVKHISAKYHAQISLVSRPEEGTSIRIMLPVARADVKK